MIYLVEDGNTYEMEQAEYSVTQLWSDIGGAGGNGVDELPKDECFTEYLGLMLGISFATLIGVVDCLCSFLWHLFLRGSIDVSRRSDL